MDAQSIPLGLRILIAFPIMFVVGSVLSYFKSPEDFFIKRFRPNDDAKYTHAQLLFRAFIGLGLISTILLLGPVVVIAYDGFTELRPVWIAMALTIGLFLAISSYLYFRIWRYVEIAPSEQGAPLSSTPRIFIRRAAPNPDTWGLRLTLIILFAVVVVAGPAILIILSIVFWNLFS